MPVSKATSDRAAMLVRADMKSFGVSRRQSEEAAVLVREKFQDKADPFLGGEWKTVSSSNVAAFRYLIDSYILDVEFLDGSIYAYINVPPRKAQLIFESPSAGKAVWDYLRIRGTKLGHQHEYIIAGGPIRSGARGLRLWQSTPGRAKVHRAEIRGQSEKRGGFIWKEAKEAAKAKGRTK